MKKFVVPAFFNGVKAPFTIYIGDPESKHHPLHFQADWLSRERGGTIPQEVMDSIAKLKELADKNNVSFEELCVYALGSAQQEMDATDTENQAEPGDENAEGFDDSSLLDDAEVNTESNDEYNGDNTSSDDSGYIDEASQSTTGS